LPAFLAVHEYVSPLESSSDLSTPSELSTVCGALSLFVHTTVSPTFTATSAGENLNPWIVTETVFAVEVGAGGCAGAGAGAVDVGGVDEGAVGGGGLGIDAGVDFGAGAAA